LRLSLLALVCCAVTAAGPALAQQVEVVRPTPRATGMHGWTIEVPTPGAYGSFEVLRGGRVPDAASAEEAIPVAPPSAAPVVQNVPTPPRTIQVAPVRPVAVAPVAPPEPFPTRRQVSNAPTDSSTVRVQRGPFDLSRFAPAAAALLGTGSDPAANPGAAPAPGLPPLPPGARVIRIR
jgi:hypothetical protein